MLTQWLQKLGKKQLLCLIIYTYNSFVCSLFFNYIFIDDRFMVYQVSSTLIEKTYCFIWTFGEETLGETEVFILVFLFW